MVGRSLPAALIAMVALAGCGKKSPPLPDAAEKPRSQMPAIFVELIVEVAEGKNPPAPPTMAGPLGGYFFQRESEPPVLYAASGEAPPPARGGLWVGIAVTETGAPSEAPFRRLERNAEGPAKVRTISKNAPPFLPNQGLATALRPALDVVLELDGETVRLPEAAAAVKSGEVRLLAETKLEGNADRWLAALENSCAAAGQRLPVPADVLMEALRELEKTGPPCTYRLWLHNHGAVEIGNIDLAREWKAARRAATEARYADALAGLEGILRAVPDHEASLLLMARLMEHGEINSTTAQITGVVRFSGGGPDEKLRAIFKTYGEGLAYLLPEGGGTREILFSAPVKDGRFALAAPVGIYRLVVEAPGYRAEETPLSLQGNTNREITLEK